MDVLSWLSLLPLEPRPSAPRSSYDVARRAFTRLDQVTRRSHERVDRFCRRVRRWDAEQAQRMLLPGSIIRLQGPAAGVTGGRVVIENRRAEPGRLSMRALPFAAAGRDTRALPALGTRPESVVLSSGAVAVVTLWLDLRETPFRADDSIHGDVELLFDDELAACLGVEVDLYEGSV